MLERGLKSEIPIGDFTDLEDQTLQILTESRINLDFKVTMAKIKTSKLEANSQEIEMTRKKLESTNKTISTSRLEMKAIVSKSFYEKWTTHVDGIGRKFTEIFSSENEDLFKKAEKDAGQLTVNKHQEFKNKSIENVYYRIHSFAKNVATPYIEDEEMKTLFQINGKNIFDILEDDSAHNPEDDSAHNPENKNATGNQEAKEKKSELTLVNENRNKKARYSPMTSQNNGWINNEEREKENAGSEGWTNSRKRKNSYALASITNEMNISSSTSSKKEYQKMQSENTKQEHGEDDEVGQIDSNEFEHLLNEYVK